LSPTILIPEKNGKLKICIDFKKLNVATNNFPYPLPFTYEMLNIIAWHEAYFLFDGYLGYHQIFITPKDIYKTTFVID
jgi:putative transposase